MKLTKVYLLALFFAASSSFADGVKHIQQSLSTEDFERLKLELNVGELEIEIWDEDALELDIELRGERGFLALQRRNVDNIELEIKANDDELTLAIDERNIEQDWSLKVPAKLAMEIEMGVGEVVISDLRNSLVLNHGVGSVEITTADIDFKRIATTVGVGDAMLKGFDKENRSERSFLRADASYDGDGEYNIWVELGVGDISIRR